MMPFHALTDVADISPEQLSFCRSKALYRAVQQSRDCTLVRVQRHPAAGELVCECLVIDLECDGVPSKNPVGIRYCERIALCVGADPKEVVEVLALRQDFPLLIHENSVAPGGPASLCLYFETGAEVARTWTAPAFIRRIQWWLEKSAREELHPADHPVEHLFYASNYELILPWNYAEIRDKPEQKLTLMLGAVRPDKTFTFVLRALKAGDGKAVTHIELKLPPIIHGSVERDPSSLGELADLLATRGVDLILALRNSLQALVGSDGRPASGDDEWTVIMLDVPVQRDASLPPEKTLHRAFLVSKGPLALGLSLGTLMLHEGRYFKDLLNQHPTTIWREEPIHAMQVLKQNDRAAARLQSGLIAAGPTGTLIGAGALGSALVGMWARSGWGAWTVIDKDHIKPHNLSRHAAYFEHVGEPKAEIVAALCNAATGGASATYSMVANAADFSQESVTKVLGSSELIVDASTTLEFPRAASFQDGFGRLCSVFITPSGCDSVMLLEDAKRRLRLRTLEAQYYRLLLQTDVGRDHLVESPRNFWSGASCRDISVVMPYSAVLAHASVLADQIRVGVEQEDAVIKVWQRKPASGAISACTFAAFPEVRIQLDDLTILYDEWVAQKLYSLREASVPNETGGILLGYHDFLVGTITIVDVLPAPTDSKSDRASFERGVAGIADAIRNAANRTGGQIGYVGEWHSHPPGHSASPSHDDLIQLVHLALGMAEDGLPVLQVIVSERELQVVHGAVR